MYRMIAFDMDGTLADTLPLCMEAFVEGVSPYVGHRLEEREVTRLYGLNEVGMIKALVGARWEPAWRDYQAQYIRLHSRVTEPFDGIRELLEWLKREGVILALITGKHEATCAVSLNALGLNGVFEETLCCSEEEPNKAERMEYLLGKYGMPREAFCYVGDAPGDIDACRRAGVTCMSAAWQPNPGARALEAKNPGRVYGRAADLRRALEQL